MDKSKHNQVERKRCRTDSAPPIHQIDVQEDQLDARDNPALVSGKGSIKFIITEEKGPGKMLRKWNKKVSGWKAMKEKQRA